MNEKVIIRSSARDLHGLQTGKQLLDRAVEAVNGTYKMRQLANHRRDYPPTGYLDNAVLATENDIDLVIGEIFKYSESQPVTWDDALEMQTLAIAIKFKQRDYDLGRLTVTIDPNNYPSRTSFDSALDEMVAGSTEPLTFVTDTRKNYLLSNRVIVTFGTYYAVVHPFVSPF